MKSYDRWRENEIKCVGPKRQHEAEEKLEKHYDYPLVETINTRTGEKEVYRENVAQIYERRRELERPKKYFLVPDLPWKK